MLVEGVAVAGRNDVQILGTSAVLKKKKFCYFSIFFQMTHTHKHTHIHTHTHTQTYKNIIQSNSQL